MQHNEEENDEVLQNLIIKPFLGKGGLESPHIFVQGIQILSCLLECFKSNMRKCYFLLLNKKQTSALGCFCWTWEWCQRGANNRGFVLNFQAEVFILRDFPAIWMKNNLSRWPHSFVQGLESKFLFWMFQPYCRSINEIKSSALFKSFISLKGFVRTLTKAWLSCSALLFAGCCHCCYPPPQNRWCCFPSVESNLTFLFIIQPSWGFYSISREL